MRKLTKQICQLFKSEDTILIESIAPASDVFLNGRPSVFKADRNKTLNYSYTHSRIELHSVDLSSRLDFDADVFINVTYGYKGKKYNESTYDFIVSVDFTSRIRITRNGNQINDVRVNEYTRKAIESRIKSLIQIK
jgi:hypothetical protein